MTTQSPTSPGLVDVHAHFITEDYVAAALAAGHGHPDGMPGWPDWSADAHLRSMDRWGVERSMLSISSPGIHFGDDAAAGRLGRQVNIEAARLVRQHPDRFGHFASLPLPDVDGALGELEYALDQLGSDGVVVKTNSGGRYLGDEGFSPLLDELDRRAAIVFVHPTSPPAADQIALGRPSPMLEFIFDTTRTVSDLLYAGGFERYPRIKWIFTHSGGALPVLADRLELFRRVIPGDSNARAFAEQLSDLWFDIAGTPFPRQVPALVTAFGAERLLYGSDHCWTPAAAVDAQLAAIDRADQPPNDSWRALTRRNTDRLLARADAPSLR